MKTERNVEKTSPTGEVFFERLNRISREKDSLLCVGLDPSLDAVQDGELEKYCKGIVEATKGAACAYKPNAAFFEARGSRGFAALQNVVAHIRSLGFPVILDAKRGDISSTALAYAKAAFDVLGADALTVNPLLGGDSVEGFASRADRGVFVLCHTSNPGARDLQELEAGGAPLYEHIARLAAAHGVRGNVGLVIGATYPEVLERVRRIVPQMWFLLPGIGAQGGDLAASLRAGLTREGTGVLVNVSRGISEAADPGRAALDFRDRINEAREKAAAPRGPDAKGNARGLVEEIALGLHDLGAVRFGEFTLKSGLKSPIYVDLRLLVSAPKLMALAAKAIAGLVSGLSFDRIAAIPYGGLPIGEAVSLQTGKPLIYPRREVKEHGTRNAIEGTFSQGETALVLDDLITTGGSKIEALEPLQKAGLKIRDVAVLIDRGQGGGPELARRGYALHALFTIGGLIDILAREGRIKETTRDEVRAALGIQ